MDFGDIGANLPIILLIIGLVLLQFFLRRRKPEVGRQEVVQSLLSEVRLNQAVAKLFEQQQKPRRFETVSWQRNKNKLDFLGESLQRALSDAFGMAEDYNQQIGAAKKYKSTSYLVSIDVDKLKEPLAKSREGLEEWLLSNVGRKESPSQYPGFFERFFGGRG